MEFNNIIFTYHDLLAFQLFKAPFSRKQKMVLEWWMPGSPYADMEGIICDGSIRSGKTTGVMPCTRSCEPSSLPPNR